MAHKRIANKPRVLGAGRWLRLVEVDGWEFVERVKATGVVAIVAVTPDGELILTEQFRRSVNGRVIDLPAGLAGDGPESEELVTAARRELIEETGYDARRFTLLAHAPTSPGLTTEVVSFFRAAGLKKVGRRRHRRRRHRHPQGQTNPGRRMAPPPGALGETHRLQGIRRAAFLAGSRRAVNRRSHGDVLIRDLHRRDVFVREVRIKLASTFRTAPLTPAA